MLFICLFIYLRNLEDCEAKFPQGIANFYLIIFAKRSYSHNNRLVQTSFQMIITFFSNSIHFSIKLFLLVINF